MEIQIVDTEEALSLCNFCRDLPLRATERCLACQALCCDDCKRTHLSNARFSQHKIISLNSKLLCYLHSEEMVVYCMDDMRACCLTCIRYTTYHKGHTILDFAGAFEVLSSSVVKCKNRLNERKTEIENRIINIHEQRNRLNTQCKDIENELKKQFKNLKKKINQGSKNERHLIIEKTQNCKSNTEKNRGLLADYLSEMKIKTNCDEKEKIKQMGLLKSLLKKPVPGIELEEVGSSTFIQQGECCLDCLSYTETLANSRWNCRVCNNTNFPKDTTCRKCKTFNHIVSLRNR